MSEFISWYERETPQGKEILFLTHQQIFETPDGERMRKETGNDYIGHSAIRSYYHLPESEFENGNGANDYASYINGECTDFSTPENFPAVISEAIKQGKMRGLAAFPKGLLRTPLDADYEAKRAPLYADYEAKRAPLDADYEAKRAPLDFFAWELFADTKNRSKAWR